MQSFMYKPNHIMDLLAFQKAKLFTQNLPWNDNVYSPSNDIWEDLVWIVAQRDGPEIIERERIIHLGNKIDKSRV